MAVQAGNIIVSFRAGANLTGSRYRFVTLGTEDGTVVLAGANSRVLGVLQNAPNTGMAASVAIAGVAKVVAGGSISRGSLVRSDANGAAVAATLPSGTWSGSTEHVAGIALEAASAGQLVEILLTPFSYGR